MNERDTIDRLERQLGADLRRSVHAVLDVNLEITGDEPARGDAVLATTEAGARRRTSRRRLLLTVAAGGLVIAGVGATALLVDDRADAPSALGNSASSPVGTVPTVADAATQTVASATTATGLVAPDLAGIFLPELPIDGYRLDHVMAVREEMPVLQAPPGDDAAVTAPGDATVEGVRTSVSLVAIDGAPGQLILFDTFAAPAWLTVEDLLAEVDTGGWGRAELVALGNAQAILHTAPADRFGTMVSITWLLDGNRLMLSTRLPADDALAVAESVHEVSLAEAVAVRAGLDEQFLAMDELDLALLPNGFEVSVRADANSADAAAVCLHAPIVRCQSVSSESSLGGEPALAFAATFLVEGQHWIVGWHADGEYQPVVVEFADQDDASTATNGSGPGEQITFADNIAQGQFGTFVAVEETTPGLYLKFDASDIVMYAGGIAPNDLLLSGD